jgi:Zn-dependent protease with chaperone function
MEFHADEVAANIAGSLALEESLLRLELADSSYQNVLSFYDKDILKMNRVKISTANSFLL